MCWNAGMARNPWTYWFQRFQQDVIFLMQACVFNKLATIALDWIFKSVTMGLVENSPSDRRVNRMFEKDRLCSHCK